MDLSVIIVNYDSAPELKKCLSSILTINRESDSEIIVIDNNSTEREIDKLPDEFSGVNFYFRENNRGFGSGCNFGAEKASGKFLAFINPDIRLTEDVIPEIIKFMKQNPKSGSCAPKLLSDSNKYQSSTGFNLGFIYEFLEAFMLIKVYRKIDYILRNRYRQKVPVPVKWVSGAFMVIRKELFEKLKGFDESFFLNYEDIDLCKRLNNAGHINYYFPYLSCSHSALSSQSKNYEKLVISRYESRIVYAGKHYNLLLRVTARVFHIFGLILRIVISLFKSGTKENKERSNGYIKSLSMYLSKSILNHKLKEKILN